ncbi:FAD-binding protein [Undibacterium umbellatum]|uniref:FAD-binding oxidoreductase n=1 Tax=Undibacterium umbellatum TaxID=2762300 RepID=A0ABR6Z694_9BURK|nr:FAD-binding oxidoreductase [Undibacterium umbellatum]MBC3907290.1 FAD-binding oxidoreductase [Undibacterium umbellatum]
MHKPEPTNMVNDVHSALNLTTVSEIKEISSLPQLATALEKAKSLGRKIAISAAKHAMGGQQFAENAILLDMRSMDKVLNFDRELGIIEVEAGIQWPALIDYLEEAQKDSAHQWGIRQKQTGADDLSIGGCLSANVHGRGLQMRPFIDDVESFSLLDAENNLLHCSRDSNNHLFRLAIGGYGMFGVITKVSLRLTKRQKMRRDVSIISLEELMPAFAQRIDAGYVYGDFQFAIDPASPDFLQRGVFSCYCPVSHASNIKEEHALSDEQWQQLLVLAHVDKSRAFDCYAQHYMASSGQTYWSDRLQQTTYLNGYHKQIDSLLGHQGSEMIGELYVPKAELPAFMRDAAQDFRQHGVDLIYGTVRLIEADTESFMPWARQDYACVIFNLHTEHTECGITATGSAFRRLIDLAIKRDGSFYLTYGRFATAEQIRHCYPNFENFLAYKHRFDPELLFQSTWFQHHAAMFAAHLEQAA